MFGIFDLSIQIAYPADIYGATGLVLDPIGIILLFVFVPEKFPDPQTKAFFRIDSNFG